MKKLIALLISVVVLAVLSVNVLLAQETPAEDRTGWPENFIVGVYPGDNIEEALANVEPLRIYLEETLGIRVVLITGTSYTAVIEAMRAGRADAMEVGPFSYVLAVQEANAEAIAIAKYNNNLTLEDYATQVDLEEIPGYYSLLFTTKGTGITTIEDIAGRSFAFTDPASTSGYLVPATTIMDTMAFDDPTQLEDFANLVFAGNHPSAVLSVSEGTTDAGATFDGNLTAQADEGLIELCGYDLETKAFPYYDPMTTEEIAAIYDACPEGNVVVFSQSALIVETPFAIRGDLPQSFKDAVKEALLAIKDQPEIAVALKRYYLDPSEAAGVETLDELYNPLRVIAEKLQLDLKAR
ncbi:MAG: phosphate/phosphite/phosphonate ABC transporter substrate-binding protein [Armatimonadetes bacterium]|nr:phosphate/phosphite/phosphonate ABC transporter substrate-binding protein [Anaerolineae bacterium]